MALIVLAGCGGGDSVDVGNVDPQGSVGGLIVDAQTRDPLTGVTIALLAGGEVFEPQTTADDGSFRFEEVPGGDVILTIAGGDNHSDATVRGTLPSSAGDFPLDNATLTLGPLGLLPNTETFDFRILDQFGAPVSGYPVGAELQVQYVDYTGGFPDAEGQIFIQTTTNADGYASIAGLPDFFALGSVNDAILVFLPPHDADGNGIFEFPGGDTSFNLRSLDPTPDIILDGNLATSLTIRASTIPRLVSGSAGAPAVLQTSGQIYMTFNLPIQNSVEVTMTNEQGGAISVPTSALAIADDTLSISLGGLGLTNNSEYNLQIHAVAAAGDRFVIGDFAASFFTVSTDPNVSVTAQIRDAVTQQVIVTFNEPIGFGNVGSNSTLSGGNCVVFFGFDINGANGQGDYVNELGATSCNVSFSSNEWDPPGQPTLSGYSSRWQFTAPLQTPGGEPIPGGITVHLLFDHAVSTGSVAERADGRAVQNLTFSLP